LDNTGINKSYVIVTVMGALCLIGTVRKVKISYLLRGHSHTFGDGLIGAIGTKLIEGNMQTFRIFRKAVKAAASTLEYAHCDCFQLVGITDYNHMFRKQKQNPHGMNGKALLIN
jgi:hypothetical protein